MYSIHPMLDQLFGSKTRVKVLGVLFNAPEKPFFVRELSRAAGVQINAVRRELNILLQAGLVNEKQVDDKQDVRRKFYALNEQSIIAKELSALLAKNQLLCEQALLRKLRDIDGAQLILACGIFVGDKELPVDLLVVGDVAESELKNVVQEYEKKLSDPLRYTLFSQDEYQDRKRIMDKFLYDILDSEYAIVAGERV